MLFSEEDYPDVIRKAQEIVELALKGMLRAVGIEPPKIHDVSSLLMEHRERFAPEIARHLEELSRISKKLRKEIELAFYGDIDFIPTKEYSKEDAEQTIEEAETAVGIAEKTIQPDLP